MNFFLATLFFLRHSWAVLKFNKYSAPVNSYSQFRSVDESLIMNYGLPMKALSENNAGVAVFGDVEEDIDFLRSLIDRERTEEGDVSDSSSMMSDRFAEFSDEDKPTEHLESMAYIRYWTRKITERQKAEQYYPSVNNMFDKVVTEIGGRGLPPITYMKGHSGGLEHMFEFKSVLGDGGGSRVFLVERKDPIQAGVAESALASVSRAKHFNDLRMRNTNKYALKLLAGISEQGCRQIVEEAVIHWMVQVDSWGFPHKNIPQLIEVIVIKDNFVLLLMEPVEGVTLSGFLGERGGKLEEAEALPIFRQLQNIVEHLHSLGVTHRDLKLNNLMLTSEGTLKMIDFGLATTSAFTKEHETYVGTMGYIAPEVLAYGLGALWLKNPDTFSMISDADALIFRHILYPDIRGEELARMPLPPSEDNIRERGLFSLPPADFWAMGVCLYAMVHGGTPYPYTGDSTEHVKNVYLYPAVRIASHLSVEAKSLLKAYLKWDPVEREKLVANLGERRGMSVALSHGSVRRAVSFS